MVLSSADALAKIKDRPNHQAIADALRWQNRVRFHGLTVREKRLSRHWPVFRDWAFSLIDNTDVKEAFDRIVQFPLPTNRLAAEVQDGWTRLFDAVNPQFDIEADEEAEVIFEDHLDAIGESDYWALKAIPLLWESHNDFLIVDMDAAGKPFFSNLPLDSVIDAMVKEDGVCEYIAYKTTSDSIVVLCDLFYRVYAKPEGQQEYVRISEVPHRLGYCPARLLWGERVTGNAVASASPVDEVLNDLDFLVLWWYTIDLHKMKSGFPSTYEVESIESPAPFQAHGFGSDAGMPDNCPPEAGQTAKKQLNTLGLGVHRIVPPTDDPKAPVGMVEPSIETLQFHAEDRESMYRNIKQYLKGEGGESNLMNQAMNEKQVTLTFSGKENPLMYLSRILSATRSWTLTTMGKLWLGDRFQKAIYSFGTEFYSQKEADLWNELQTAKKSGAPQTVVLEKISALQTFRHRQQPQGAGRSKLLFDLEPYADLSITELIGFMQAGLVVEEDVLVKIQFNQLIRQMEREYGVDVQQIGSALDYATRIEKLNSYLYSNVKKGRITPDPAAGSTGAVAA